MSYCVILKKERPLPLEQWQQAIASHGFALRLLSGIEPGKDSGQIRYSYLGSKSSFEYALLPVAEQGWLEKLNIRDIGDRDMVVRFTESDFQAQTLLPGWTSFYDLIAQVIAAAALAAQGGGILISGLNDDTVVQGDKAPAYGRYHEAWVMQFIYERHFDTMLFMPTDIEIMPVLQHPRLQALFARQVEIFGNIFDAWKRTEAQRDELSRIEKEICEIVEKEGS